jgi:hypothetical protein
MARLLTQLLAGFAWRDKHDTGVWIYQENTITGKRRAVRVGGGWQPLRSSWLNGGAWDLSEWEFDP